MSYGVRTLTADVRHLMGKWPEFGRRVDRRVVRILRSGKVGHGAWVERFERSFSDWCGGSHAVALSNGTTALHAAFAAIGVGPGDEVICPAYSFIASSFSIMLAGAQPVFCDVGDDHLLDISKAGGLVNRRTKAILVVHLYGIVADMDPIMRFARRHHLKVVEDCAQCLGGVYRGRRVGTLGDVGCFSFCQSKHITTGGEGGLALTADPAVAERLREFRSATGSFLTEIQAAIGLDGLSRLSHWNLSRRRLGKRLLERLKDHPLVRTVPPDTPERVNSYWLVPLVIRTELLDCSGFRFVAEVQAEGAGAYAVLWPETYNEGAFACRRGFGPDNAPFDDRRNRMIDYSKAFCPVAHAMFGSVIAFWTHPTHSLRDIEADVRAFNAVAARHMRVCAEKNREKGKEGL